jgi:hypothetical protein
MSVTHEDTRGWDAIEAAVALVVADPSPLHWGTGTVPGQTGIYGLSAYRADGHWLLVTFGLTDLFGQDQGAEVSGWGLAFAEDPQLPRIDSPLGRALFLTVVGITADELARMKVTSTDQVLATLSPLLITDPAR